MKKLQILTVLMLAALPGLPAAAQPVTFEGRSYAPGDPLPTDPELRTIQLSNGLTLFLRRNSEPENRVAYALAERAGSLEEEEDERGLAHFLEHMAFNGTERFPGQAVRDFLEKTGMKFGADVNAYTAWTKTVYTLDVPADQTGFLEKAAMITADWAQRIGFDPAEIDKERGVIIEEDRLRDKNLNGRLMKVIVPAYFGDSRYARRLPIGDMDVVRKVQQSDFLRFYRRWYRPELQAVVAVGDADPALLQKQLSGELGALEPLSGPPLPQVPPPLGNGPVYKVVTDPEMPVVVGLVTFKQAYRPLRTVADYRAWLTDTLFVKMVQRRFDELTHSAAAPFQQASFERSELAGVNFYELTLVTDAAGFRKGLEAAAAELARVRARGFGPDELALAKKDLERTLQEAYDKRNDTESSLFVQAIVKAFLKGEPFTSAEWDYQAGRQLLGSIMPEDANARAALFADAANRIALAIGPEQEKAHLPSAADLEAVFAQATGAPAEEAQVKTIERLMEPPPPAAVAAEGELPELGFRWFELANGVRVWVKPTDFVADQVLFAATSWGGASLYPDEDYPEAVFAPDLVSEAGVAGFDRVSLDRFLAGRNVGLEVSIDDETEGMQGRTDRDDLETLLQLAHLYFTSPRRDEAAARRVIERTATRLEHRRNLPDAVFSDAIQKALYGDSPRYTTPTPDRVRALDVDRAYAIYGQRFANAADFGFVFVGDVDYGRVRELAARYLGSLPTSEERERYRDHLPPLPEPAQVTVRKGLDQQARVWYAYVGESPAFAGLRTRLTNAVLRNVLSLRLLDTIREQESGSYAPRAFADFRLHPRPRYQLGFTFTAAPDRLDGLSRQAAGLLQGLAASGPAPENLAKAKEQLKRALEEAFKQNEFWRGVAEDYLVLGAKTHPEKLLQAPATAAALTAADVQKLARALIEDARPVEVRLLPEK